MSMRGAEAEDFGLVQGRGKQPQLTNSVASSWQSNFNRVLLLAVVEKDGAGADKKRHLSMTS
eukprot:scaffold24312_cov16-Prasinocladus_malaysianus.AAC.3